MLLVTELALKVDSAGTENPGYEAAIVLGSVQKKKCDSPSKCLLPVRANACYYFQEKKKGIELQTLGKQCMHLPRHLGRTEKQAD